MNFRKIVKKILGSVFSLFRFTLQSESKGAVEYEHKVLVISISYDFTRSFEVDVNFHFKANNKSYTLSELREYLDKEKNQFRAIQILDDDKLKIWTQDVKGFLENHLNELIKNHVKICFELDGLREQNVKDYNDDREVKFFKEDVDKFWSDKDYTGLVEFVKKHKGNIDGALKKKYEYALKKVK